VVIYLACDWFVNAVEWLGQRLKVGPLAVGTILAAFGTALPESVVTFVAVVFGTSAAQKDIGVGAAMGGPLALATVAYGATGWMMLSHRHRARAQVMVPASGPAAGLGADEDLQPLLLQRHRSNPATWAVVTQTLVTLAIIFVASQLFVHQLDAIGPLLGLSATVTALLLSPIATELPEIMNAIIWVRQGKTVLALANISGAMMIQATVPSGLGLLFTPWRFTTPLVISGITTMVAIAYLLVLLRTGRFNAKTLSVAAVAYLVFAVGLVPVLA
jgi:cation:H+ antiporter